MTSHPFPPTRMWGAVWTEDGPIAEVGNDGIALSWSRCPDADNGMDGDNWTDVPAIPWPFVDDGRDELIPYGVAIAALKSLGFTICEY